MNKSDKQVNKLLRYSLKLLEENGIMQSLVFRSVIRESTTDLEEELLDWWQDHCK